MGMFKNMFTWWEGAGFSTMLFTRRNGRQVGKDAHGNLYYVSKQGDRRWVIYNGPNDTSRIPADWYAWMHRQIDGVPDDALPPVRKFEKPREPNLTGTVQAYRPSGALERGGQRAAASGDYEAWVPE
ncbi:MAG TPA: NADH:ubiquinone oxidoreductase subunit NDUFA12 [Allosphingosinicella sp.]|uniref:NADH:ubiquinone oxidoreductase subunit NDUFA12 n=1 Tax=Allosphingosinicella sp. TaxID=2823234 RepID=UPI002F2A26AB